LLAVSDQLLESDLDPIAESVGLLEEVRERLGDSLRDVPGPVLVVPFDVLALAARRDVAADAEDTDAARTALGLEGTLHTNYAEFLTAVNESRFTRRLSTALSNLVFV